MGFYGNISNTSKTTFQFDRTYANKRDMDNGARLGDGVYPGRYVLVDYSQKTQDGFYDITGSLEDGEAFWMYDGSLYKGSPNQCTVADKYFYSYPNRELLVTKDNNLFSTGEIIRIPVGRRANNVNHSSIYVRITNISSNGKYSMDFEVNAASYNAWLTEYLRKQIEDEFVISNPSASDEEIAEAVAARVKASYYQITLTPITYEPNTFFIYNEETEEYENDTKGIFDEAVNYYQRLEIKDFDIFLTTSTSNIDGMKYGEDILTASAPLQAGHIYRIPKWHRYSLNYKDEFWQIQSIGEDGLYKWRAVVEDQNSDDTYFKNLSIDRAYISEYGDSTGTGATRGYDSTVWQKTVVGGQDKYVMIAELNSVVPTFDIAFDAPTMIPLLPHFDKDSTNVYYKLHTQPQWGFRTKSAKHLMGPSIDLAGGFGGSSDLSTDTVIYPSDQVTNWKGNFYNTYTGEEKTGYFSPTQTTWTETCDEKNNSIEAAIYYNKKGFDPKKVSYSEDIINSKALSGYNKSIADSGWTNEDKISIAPTGMSGQEYKPHKNGTESKMYPDTQELSIMLPSLGDTISKIWDMVFGGRDTNDAIKNTNMRNMDYEWEDAKGHLDRNGLRLVHYRSDKPYNTAEVNTLAGCINAVHDLMGMIVTADTVDKLSASLDNLDEERIYYVNPTDDSLGGSEAIKKLQGQYTMKHKTYVYTPVTLTTGKVPLEESEVNADDFDKTQYYVKNADGTYRKATASDVGPFYKEVSNMIDPGDIFEPIEGMEAWTGQYHYLDINSSPYNKVYNSDGSLDLTMQDYIIDTKYQKGHQYYEVTPSETLELSGAYEPGKFFYSDGNGYWLDFNESSTNGRTYYTVDESLVKSIKDDYDGIYMPGLYYYYKDGEYIKDMSVDGTNDKGEANIHYTVKIKDKEEENIGYVKQVYFIAVSYKDVPTLLITNNRVYKKVYSASGAASDDKGKFDYVEVGVDETISPSTEYAVEQIIYTPAEDQVEIDTENQLNLTPFVKNTFFFKKYDEEKKFLGYYPVTMQEIDPSNPDQQFYAFGMRDKLTNNHPYIATTDADKNRLNFALMLQSAFYTPHIYHYITSNNSYVLDNYLTKTHDEYCKIESATLVDLSGRTFYEPGEYYTKNPVTGEYELVRDIEMPEDIDEFYKEDKYYILEDKAGVYEKGAEWDSNILEVPSTVTLAKRTETWELIPLEDFARGLNTIHGLIVKINQMLLAGDKYTRDDSTVQGTINKMQDLIARFHELAPEKFLAVDNYGRVRGMDWSTDQAATSKTTKALDSDRKGVAADKFAKVADTVEDMYKQWLTVNIDGTITNPLITIHHNFQKVKDTSHATNLNTDGVASSLVTDKLTLLTPLVDDMGHMVGKHEETFTLPYGFKTIKTNGRSTDETVNTADDVVKNDVVADNTQDILSINSGNKWIRIDTDKDNDSIKISHDIHATSSTTSSASLSSEESKNVTFDIPTYAFDKAGHYVSHDTKTLTMPFGYGKIIGDSGNTAATATFDTLTFGSDEWLTATVTKDKVVYSHDYPKKVDDTTSTSDVNGNGDTIVLETLERDEKGHVTKVNENTVTLPYGYKIFTDSNTTIGKSTAKSTQDTFVFEGDSWLKPTVSDGKAKFEHIGPVSSTYTSKSNATPKFGETFTIEDWYFDSKGHKFKGETHTVTIPKGSLTDANATGADVITQLAFVESTGALSTTRKNLSELTLTGYTKKTDNADVAATDTLAEALSKLQTQINDEENARAQAIRDLLGGENINAAFDTIQEIAAWLEGNDSGADGVIDAIETLNGDETTEGSVKKQIKDAIDGLPTVSDIVTSTDSNLAYEVPADFNEDADKTIAWLFQKVAQLEERIATLEP